jgi:hypothetical protein
MNKALETKPRFNGCPLVCQHANLPSFESVEQIHTFRSKQCGEHPTPVLATWFCKHCQGYHFWPAGSQTDSNGAFKSGADLIPDRIKKLLHE